MAALNCTPGKDGLRHTARSKEAKKPRQNKPTGYKVLKPTSTHIQPATKAEGTGTEKQYTLYFAQDATETAKPALNHQTQLPNTGCSSTTKYGQHASYNFCIVTKLKRPTMTNSPLPAVIARSVQNLASKIHRQAATKCSNRPTHQRASTSRKSFSASQTAKAQHRGSVTPQAHATITQHVQSPHKASSPVRSPVSYLRLTSQ